MSELTSEFHHYPEIFLTRIFFVNSELNRNHRIILRKIITEIAVVGSSAASSESFHFCFALVFQDGDSIILDPKRSMTVPEVSSAPPMRTVLKACYEESVDAWISTVEREPGAKVLVFRGPVGRRLDFTCQEFFKATIKEGFRIDQYDFDQNGRGSRHWCAVVVNHLVLLGILDPAMNTAFHDWEKMQNQSLGEKFPLPSNRGTFYY
ncbi:hypothetical protein C8R42DRAFT_675686 [Lentinula raphanica]|nr:hypothetical protein C8R42DRAFT_675686 [Lentinula raphanica]